MNRCPTVREYAYHLKTIDSHTMGESTRIVYDGFPKLRGKTMMEKKNNLVECYDFLRTALILEPRGHRDMFGAVLTEPVHREADYGVIFMDNGGCLNMCGHGSIGTASMLVETGMVEVTEPYTDLGMAILKEANAACPVRHPYLDITTVDLVEFYSQADLAQADLKNCVIFGEAQADRSPCGTGTSAKMADLYTRGELGLHEEFVYESITGSLFKGEVVRELEIDGKKAIIPQITGSAYMTGFNEWILDDQDPLRFGFLLKEA